VNANPSLQPAERFRFLSPRTALVLGLAVLALAGAGLVLTALAHQFSASLAAVLIAATFAAAGVVVARQQPRNVIGWLFLTAALTLIVAIDSSGYLVLRYRFGHHGLPFGPVAVVLGLLWAVASELLPLAILLFPDGRLPSARWRPVLYGYLALAVCWPVSLAVVAMGAISGHHIAIDADGSLRAANSPSGSSAWLGSVEAVVIPLLAVFALLALGSQIARYRQAHGEHRQQLKWLLGGAVVSIVGFGVVTVPGTLAPDSRWGNGLINIASSLLILALPICMGVAILRYRLYDIDRLISRTLTYAILTGLLVGVFIGIVALATDVLPFSSPVAVAASTLAAAALFNPLRVRVQRLVDRRFNRSRYDAEAIVSAFTMRLRDAVDLDTVRWELLLAVDKAVEPTHASLWLSPSAHRTPR
jgi:hypothetical protein